MASRPPRDNILKFLILTVAVCAAQLTNCGQAAESPNRLQASKASAPAADLARIDSLADTRAFYKARQMLAPLLVKYSQDPQVHACAARLFQKMGQLSRALDEYEKVRLLSPSDARPLVALSEIYLSRDDQGKAISLAKQAIALNPRMKEARVALVRVLMTKGLLLEAEQELKKLLTGGAQDAQVHFMAARLYRDRGETAEALRHIDEAIRLQQREYRFLIERSDICLLTGNYKQAKESLEKVLKHDRESQEALNKLAIVKENYFRDYDGAMACYNEILAINPDSVTALAGLDRLKAKKNDLAGQWKYQIKSTFSRFSESLKKEGM
ncbi:MAG TPA: tetratricopeptide repeat protein [Candidatus Obscuribacterales bacterium]